MLEAEIKNLTEAINVLIKTIKEKEEIKEVKPKSQKIEKAVKDLTPTTPEIPKEIKEAVIESPTVEDLQSLCARIVRTNRDKKKDIVKLLENYNGAKTISQVPTESLEELKSKLLEL